MCILKTYPMYHTKVNEQPISRGYEQIRVTDLLFFIFKTTLALTMFATSNGEIQDVITPNIYKIISDRQMDRVQRDNSYVNEVKMSAEQKQDDFYISRSGDPWESSSSVKSQEKYDYIRILSSSNTTFNDTKNVHVLNDRKLINHARFKRGVIHLYNMVVCATGCNPLAYKGYGCYCGFLGSGYVIDGIDRCCKMHDWCYDATECSSFSEYFVPYYWRCYHGYQPICAIEHGSWGGSGSCAQRLCECDRSLAECLRRYPCPTTKAVCTSSPWRLVQNLFMII